MNAPVISEENTVNLYDALTEIKDTLETAMDWMPCDDQDWANQEALLKCLNTLALVNRMLKPSMVTYESAPQKSFDPIVELKRVLHEHRELLRAAN